MTVACAAPSAAVDATRPPSAAHTGRDGAGSDQLVRALGWGSAGLGVPLLAAPGPVARCVGLGDGPVGRALVAAVGGRELMAAAGLLRRGGPCWLWARVGGDAVDLALLGWASAGRQGRRSAVALAAVAGIAVLDGYAALSRSRAGAATTLRASVTVAVEPAEAYRRWRRLEDLPAFMAHLDEVRVTGEATTHWRASAPFGRTVEWDARITEEVPGELLAWCSLAGSAVDSQGEVRFRAAPGGRGTEVRVSIRYAVPGGGLGRAVARYFGEEPHQQLDDDLRRFKQVVETGEVVRSDGAPGGKRARREFPQRPARPLSADELARVRA